MLRQPQSHDLLQGVDAAARLETLRAAVRKLEGADLREGGTVLSLGLPELDGALPGGGLPLSCLHEISGARAEWDDGAITGFCVHLLAGLSRLRAGPLLWIAPRDDLYPPALPSLGLDPARLILVRARGSDLFWALEEGLRCPDLAAVVGEVEQPERLDIRAGRRLQLAAEASGVTAFLLHRPVTATRAGRREASAAVTRWRISATPSDFTMLDSAMKGGCFPNGARWRLELLRCRGAAPRSWLLEWRHGGPQFEPGWTQSSEIEKGGGDALGESESAPRGFALAAALRDGSSPPSDAEAAGEDERTKARTDAWGAGACAG